MDSLFAGRIGRVHRSFVTEILGVTENPAVISFAGGIPNPTYFPVREVADAAAKVLAEDGGSALQYTTTQGFPPLRQYIADRYRSKYGVDADPADIVITNGSQQAFDLIGKVILEPRDRVVMERPAYHGALQAFSLFDVQFAQVPLLEDGPDLGALSDALDSAPSKLYYGVPSFQNPSGLTYSLRKREQVADLLASHDMVMVEDDPYGEIRFEGQDLPPVKKFLSDNTILLGTFSKTVAPGFRLGWAWARRDIIERLVLAKQAADFHSDNVAQRVIYRYLADNDLDAHIALLKKVYRRQHDWMLAAIERHIPKGVRYTRPQGGMFVYLTLPVGLSSMDLFELATKRDVAFVPGRAFHAGGEGGDDSLRLSFATCDEAQMDEGMRRLGSAMRELMGS